MSAVVIGFWVAGALAVVTAMGVVLHRNPVRSALFLIVNFLSLGALYLLLNAQVLAMLQILVYAGAIMVLFLFVIMLLNLGGELAAEDPLPGQMWIAAGLAVLLVAGLIWGARSMAGVGLATDAGGMRTAEAEQQGVGQIQILGYDLFVKYVYPFELTSILLLVGVIGVMLLTQRRHAQGAPEASQDGHS